MQKFVRVKTLFPKVSLVGNQVFKLRKYKSILRINEIVSKF